MKENSVGADLLDFPLFPIKFLACFDFQTCRELLHHSNIVACIVAGDMANL